MALFSLIILGFLIVISPGADFLLVLKNSITMGRASGVWTAIGISAAISIHISYSLLGIGYLISHNELLFTLIKYLGSTYLIYLGAKGLFSKGEHINVIEQNRKEAKPLHAFFSGFLCNALNPKTMLFFLSIFGQVMSIEPSSELAMIYGLYIMLLHALWFILIALLFTSKAIQARLLKMKNTLNRLCGAGLISFGILLGTHS